MKKKILLTSIATIALCLCLIAGSTFALFTSQSEVDISIKAAKVEMTASISGLKFESVQADPNGTIVDNIYGGTYSYVECTGKFINGGTATFDGANATLNIERVTPGDRLSFNVEGANTSDVTIQYRYKIECNGDELLMSALLVTLEGVTYPALDSYTSSWMTLEPGSNITPEPVVIEFPINSGNEYQEQTTSIKVTVEAVQGNADVKDEKPVVEFLDGYTADLGEQTLADTVINDKDSTVAISNGTIVLDSVGVENYGNLTLTDMTITAGTSGTQAYGYAYIGQAGSTTVLDDVTVKSANGAVAAVDGAQLTMNDGYVEVDSKSTSGRYLIYAVGEGTVVTVNDGEFFFNKTQNQKRAYAYVADGATLIINGGKFGAASTRSGYEKGIRTGDNATIIITGGTFGFDPTQWVPAGCTVTKSGSEWTVERIAVSTADELAEILTSDTKHITVTLANDIDLPIASLGQQTGGSGEYKIGGENTNAIEINLNGYKLNITTTYWSSIGAKNDNATITVKNGSMTSSQATGTWNSYDLTFANCNWVFENVIFDKAIALTNAGKTATLNNVTINETHDYYALWISAKGQTVNIDGLTVNSAGRGIKIDEQYVDAPAKVILNVKNTEFNTAKKAAILVKSAAGADIALSNVDITNTPDPVHAVWVDEDSKDHIDLVTVTGGNKYYEGDVVSGQAKLDSAIANGATDIFLGAGNFSMPTTSSDVTITGTLDTVITVGTPKANKVTLKGVTVVGSGYATGIQHSTEVVYEDCLIKGVQCLYADNVVFKNCTIDLTEKADYIWTYGAKNVLFENCTFNTLGKAILIYNEGKDLVTNVTVKDCTFNATASALAGGNVAAAIEIDSSLSTNGHYTLTTENNTVDSDFSGEWRVKKSGTDNTTVNGVVYNAVAIG